MHHDSTGESPKIDLASEGRKVVGLAAQLNRLQRHFTKTGFEKGRLLPSQESQVFCRADSGGHAVIADIVDQNPPVFVPGSNPYGHIDLERRIRVASEWHLGFGLSGVLLGVNHLVGYERESITAEAISSLHASLEKLYPGEQLTETVKTELAKAFPASTNYTLLEGEIRKKYVIEFSKYADSIDNIGGVDIETLRDIYDTLIETVGRSNQPTTMGDIEYVGSVLTKAKRAFEREFEIPDDLRREMEQYRNRFN